MRGESGVGKTFLAAEAGQRAGLAGFRVLTGECSPPVGGRTDVEVGRAPLHPFRRVLEYLADRCREGGPEISARILGERTRILARFEPSLAFAATHDTGDSALPVEPDLARSHVLNAICATLRALSEETPLVLVVDDLHWADELSIDLLTHLAAEPDRLLIIGTVRDEEVPPLLQPLLSTPNVHTISLARLGPETVAALVADMLAIPKPLPELSRYIAAQSEGNPFFAAEYLRLLVSENRLRLEGSTWDFARGQLDDPQALQIPAPALHPGAR